MSVGPRVVFLRFLSVESPKLQPWRAHFARVVGWDPELVARAGAAEEGVVTWHLVSANNRPLGRSGATFLAHADAVTSAQDAVDSHNRLVFELVADENSGMYGWFARVDAGVVLICPHWYVTERDRRKSMTLAADSLAVAALGAGARAMNPALMSSRLDVARL